MRTIASVADCKIMILSFIILLLVAAWLGSYIGLTWSGAMVVGFVAACLFVQFAGWRPK